MGKLLRKREREKEKERSAAMRSAPPPAHPGAICHHTTHHRRNDTATAVPRVLSWRQPRARYRGVTARGKSSRGMGRMRPGNTGGEHADIELIATNKAKNQRQFSKYYTTMVWPNDFLLTYSILRQANSPKYQVDKIYRHCSKNIKH